MSICSLVVHARPEQATGVVGQLTALPGVEVHGGEAVGRLVVTIEDTPDRPVADTLGLIHNLPGVLSTVLIYHYGGDDIAPEPSPT